MQWDEFYMGLAFYVAMKSKDPSTKVGAVLSDSEHRPLGFGYNGPPAGVDDSIPERWTRPAKYHWIQHAEINCLSNATSDLTGATMYTTLYPCAKCAGAIVQKRIGRVVYDKSVFEFMQNFNDWTHTFNIAKQMFEEAPWITVDEYVGPIPSRIVAQIRETTLEMYNA